LAPYQSKSLGLGVQAFLFRCLGTIPASELFNAILAPACLVWQKDMCTGKKGICNAFDNTDLANSLMLISKYSSLKSVKNKFVKMDKIIKYY